MNEQAYLPFVSVIIPTHNRFDLLHATLESLAKQTYPFAKYEVIVTDDGSTDHTPQVTSLDLPFRLVYITQTKRGATSARNRGAQHAQGELLVFLDDDIELLPEAIATLVEEQKHHPRTLVIGALLSDSLVSTREMICQVSAAMPPASTEHGSMLIPFVECLTGLLCVRAEDFLALGMFQDPTGGWPNWDDVDFGYRAHLAGYRILRSCRAKGIHHDAAAASLKSAAERWYRASKSAVRLFQKYPDIRSHLSMFDDKTAIAWRQDPPRLIARKLVRHVASSRPVLWCMEQIVSVLEQRYPSPMLLRPLYRWIIGGYIFRGYRQGLQEYAGH